MFNEQESDMDKINSSVRRLKNGLSYREMVSDKIMFNKIGLECDMVLDKAERILESRFRDNRVVLRRWNAHNICNLSITIIRD